MKDLNIWPVEYNGKLWYEKDSNLIFVNMYEFRLQLNSEGGIYLMEDMCIYPDGTTGEF